MLEYALDAIRSLLGDLQRIVIVPYAGDDYDDYQARIADALAPLGVRVTSVHTAAEPLAALDAADAVYVPGGTRSGCYARCRRLVCCSHCGSA